MNWWDDRASRMQIDVRIAENDAAHVNIHEPEAVSRAVIHTREDVVMIVSLLSSLNTQVRTVNWLLLLIAALIGYGSFR